FPTYDRSGRYTLKFPSRSTPDPTYTSSPDTPNPNPESSSNEELRGVTSDEPVFLVPNNEVNQLHRHTHAYLKSIIQIPAIYQIPRAQSSQRRTQPYGENETLVATIDNLIIDTISEIRGDSNFQDFPEEEEGGSGPPEPPENNTIVATPTYPRPNFRFIATMAANRP
ncbi:unnamed protein product, partial [Adineta steineri]